MCACNGTGRVLTELFAGVINFIPCTCEAAEIKRKGRLKRFEEFELRLVDAEKEWSRVYGSQKTDL